MPIVAAPAITVITATSQPVATRPRFAARDVETIGEKPPTTAAARPYGAAMPAARTAGGSISGKAANAPAAQVHISSTENNWATS